MIRPTRPRWGMAVSIPTLRWVLDVNVTGAQRPKERGLNGRRNAARRTRFDQGADG